MIEYIKPRTKGRGVSYGKIGLTTVAVTRDPGILLRDAVGSLFFITLAEHITSTKTTQPVPSYPNSYTSLHARKPSMQKLVGI